MRAIADRLIGSRLLNQSAPKVVEYLIELRHLCVHEQVITTDQYIVPGDPDSSQ